MKEIIIFSPGAYAKFGHSYDYCKGLANACAKKRIKVTIFGYDGPLLFDSPEILEKRIYGTGDSSDKNSSVINKIKWGYNRVVSFKKLLEEFDEYVKDNSENPFVVFETFEYMSLAAKVKKFDFPFCCILHDTNFNFKQANIVIGVYKYLCRSAVKKIATYSKQVFVHGKSMQSNLIDQIGKRYLPKVKVLPYGSPSPIRISDEDKLSSKKQLGLDESKKCLLSFGTLRQDKNFLEIFQTLRKHDDWEWLISGPEGDLKYDYIHEKAKEFNVVDKLHIHHKFIENREQPIYFGASDLVVNLYKEYIRHESGTAQLARTFLRPLVVSGPPDLTNYVEEFNIGWIANGNKSLDDILQKFNCQNQMDKKEMEENIHKLALKNSWDSVLQIILNSNKA